MWCKFSQFHISYSLGEDSSSDCSCLQALSKNSLVFGTIHVSFYLASLQHNACTTLLHLGYDLVLLMNNLFFMPYL